MNRKAKVKVITKVKYDSKLRIKCPKHLSLICILCFFVFGSNISLASSILSNGAKKQQTRWSLAQVEAQPKATNNIEAYDPDDVIFRDKNQGAGTKAEMAKDVPQQLEPPVQQNSNELKVHPIQGQVPGATVKHKSSNQIASSPGQKNEKSLVRIDWQQHQTTDGYLLTDVGLELTNHRRNFSYPYAEAATSAWDYGVRFDRFTGRVDDDELIGERGEFYLARKFSANYYLKAAAGAHKLKEKAEKEFHTIGVGYLEFDTSLLAGKFFSKFIVSRDFIYKKLAFPGGLAKKLWESKARLDLNLRFHRRGRWVLRGAAADINDDNKWRSGETSLLFGVSPSVPWVWFGAFAHHLSFRSESTDYWSPKKFIYYGLELDSSYPIIDELSWTLAGRWGPFKENDLNWGKGWSIYSGFRFGKRDEVNIEVYYLEVESKQGILPWRQKSVFVNFNYFW